MRAYCETCFGLSEDPTRRHSCVTDRRGDVVLRLIRDVGHVALRLLPHAVVLAFGVGLVLHQLHGHLEERFAIDPLAHWIRDSALSLPLTICALVLATRVTGGLVARLELATDSLAARLTWALMGAVAYSGSLIPGNWGHGLLFVAEHDHHADEPFLAHAAHDAAAGLGPALALLLVAVVVFGTPVERPVRRRLVRGVHGLWARLGALAWARRPATSGRVLVAVLIAALIAPLQAPIAGIAGLPQASVLAAPATCVPGGDAARSYDVVATNVVIPYNRWGQVDPHGQVFVLEQDRAAVENWWLPLAPDPTGDPAANRRLRPRPLVLRANVNECVSVTLRNDLDPVQGEGLAQNPRASIHVHGAAYDAQSSDGSRVGFNADTTVGIGETITYSWLAPPQEGIYFFHDHATSAGSEADGGSNAHGLFGAFVVEPAGSTWLDAVSGLPLYTGTQTQSGDLYIEAIIQPTGAPSFRESIQLAQDEIPSIGFGFNYGSEPGENREAERCPDCVGEETSLSSWPFGDPALIKLASGVTQAGQVVAWPPTPGADPEDCGLDLLSMPPGVPASCWVSNVAHAYVGDPIKFRVGLAGVKETHVFHMHAHQWLAEPFDVGAAGSSPSTPSDANRPESTTIDSQTFGPQETFTIDILFGAGSKPGTIGDSIFHCHLYPHFAEGFWSLFRVHDVFEDGNGTTPDGIRVRRMAPVADRTLPPVPTPENPGYPRFIPGVVGWRAPQPPDGVSDPDGSPATRIVAGQALDPGLLNQVQEISASGEGTDETQSIYTDANPQNEVQAISTDATGGTFTLSLGGETTTGITFDASSADVEAALENLSSVEDVDVSGSGTAADPWIITFLDPGGENIETFIADAAGLSGGDPPPSVTAITTTEGSGGGTFTLTFGGQTTPPIAFNAASADIEAALEALSSVNDVNVDGLGTAASPWLVTFVDPGGDVGELTGDASGLAGYTSGIVIQTTSAASINGSFQLTYKGATTSAIPVSAPAADLEAAVEALDTIDDVGVSGSGTVADPWVVVFNSPAKNVELLAAVADPPVTVTVEAQPQPLAQLLATELSVRQLNYGGNEFKPGAPLRDPCPAGSRQVTYNVSMVQRDIVYNEQGWHDTQGRFAVLDEDIPAIMSGLKQPEPMFIRVNAGDCVNFNLTNRMPNWIGSDAFLQLRQTNMAGEHIHLVKFDVLGSDGSSNGWNYQQAAFTEEQVAFNDAVIAGTQSCTADEASGACRIPDPATWDPANGGVEPGQTIHERWFADYELRTVFTHDHHFPAVDQNRGLFGALIVEPAGVDFRDPKTGQFLQPINNAANGAPCGGACDGMAAGALMDVIGPEASDDFREFGLGIQDFVSLTRAGGNPVDPADAFNPPLEPELYANEDPGVMAVNYRNAPFIIRDTKNGVPVDPAYRFSSWVFGDPETPLLQAYGGDSVRFRLIQGSQEEQHVVMVHGLRWRDEPDDPDSPYVNSRALGVSEAFNFEIPRVVCGPDDDPCIGDHLYTGAATDDVYLGVWGIFRIHGKGTPELLPLPDNVPQAQNSSALPNPTGSPPPKANKPGNPCPPGAPVRTVSVVAMETDIAYNEAGDHDPYGLIYALAEDEAAIRAGTKPVEPLVLRANEGDCIEVTLTNKLTTSFLEHRGAHRTDPAGGDPNLPLEPPTGTPAGLRVSLHPQLVTYDVRGSDGATIGFNRDQTVGPGQSIQYRWFADDVSPGELGATNLLDYGDVRGHRHHGLFAGLVIEPKYATYHDPYSGEEIRSGAAADIRVPGMPDFREFPVFFQDGLNLRDAGGGLVPDPFGHPPVAGEQAESLDAEDQGEKGFNYRNAPFHHRLNTSAGAPLDDLDGTAMANVFSSVVHGDPATPIFRAYAGDPVRMRILQGADKPRQHVFTQAGHAWLAQPNDPGSSLIAAVGGFSVGRKADVQFTATQFPGDYRYSCGVMFHHLSGGLWGITRIYEAPPAGNFSPSPLRAADDPQQAGYHPILPLELGQITATVFDDSNMNGSRGNAELPLSGRTVHLREADGSGTGAIVKSATTDADGRVAFFALPGTYDLSLDVPGDWAATTPTWFAAAPVADNAGDSGAFGLVQLADVTVRVYDNQNGINGYEPPAETTLPNWSVTLTGGGTSRTQTTGASGTTTFGGLKPGSYAANLTLAAGWKATQPLPSAVLVAENASMETNVGVALQAGLSVKLYNDANNSGSQGPGESSLAGWSVSVVGGPDESAPSTATKTTDANGVVDLPGLLPGRYTITQSLKPDWSYVGASATTTAAGGGTSATPGFSCPSGECTTALVAQTTQVVRIGNHNPNVWVVAEPFNDTNNDGVRQGGEKKLVGWKAELRRASDGSLVDTETTGSSGLASFYVNPGTPAGTVNQYTMTFTQPADSELDWSATPASASSGPAVGVSVGVSALAGETATARKGFIQLGTVSVMAFGDNDRDGINDPEDGPLANRTVRLYDSKGQKVLAQKATNADGYAAFQVAVSTKFQLEVLLPQGWVATAPLGTNSRPATKASLTSASSPLLSAPPVEFGQYATDDITPPPDPVASPGAGIYTSSQAVSLTSETGATIRYTLDGSTPTSTTGTVYAGPITIATNVTLKALAIDPVGNLSGVTTASYTITLPTGGPQSTGSWTVLKGTSSALIGQLAIDDANYLMLSSAKSGKKYYVDGYGRATIPAAELNLAGLAVTYDGGASVGGMSRNLYLYNFTTSAWEKLRTEAQTAADLRTTITVSGDPKRFRSASGEVRMRVEAIHSSSFQLKADYMAFSWTYNASP